MTVEGMRQIVGLPAGTGAAVIIEAYAAYLRASEAAAISAQPPSRDPFVRAVDALFWAAGSVSADFAPATGSPIAEPIRIIPSQPDETIGFGHANIRVSTNMFKIRRSEVAKPARGDVVAIDDDVYVLQGDAKLDVKRLVWTVGAEPVE